MTKYLISHYPDRETGETSCEFDRDDLYGTKAQTALETARRDGLRVTCQCGTEGGAELLIVGRAPRLHLSRRPQDAHEITCAHGKRPPSEAWRRGYIDGVIEKEDDGCWQVDLGDLLLEGEARDPQRPRRVLDGAGDSPRKSEPRATASALGVLCLLLEEAKLHRIDFGSTESHTASPWCRLDTAARNIRPRGYVSDWGLSDYLLLQHSTEYETGAANFKRVEAALGRRAILFACLLSPNCGLGKASEMALWSTFRVNLRIGAPLLAKACKRYRFAAQQLKNGRSVFAFGRAYVTSESHERNGTTTVFYKATADRLVLMAVDKLHLTPLPKKRDMNSFEKARKAKKPFVCRLPYDR